MTQETKHTPGPWRIKGGSETAHCCFEWSILADTYPGREVICEGFSDKANARLIAAAPETAAERDRLKEINGVLLAALESSLPYLEQAQSRLSFELAPLREARATIAKAKGEA